MAPSTDFDVLLKGNEQFRAFVNENHAEVWEDQADQQNPSFMFIGCADSRTNEGTIFRTLPGVLFTQRNIANQFRFNDNNVQSALFFAVNRLEVSHIIVMGHYDCGGCRAAMEPRPSPPLDFDRDPVQDWIEPIRNLYATTERPDIVHYRSTVALQHAPLDDLKGLDDNDSASAAVKALIEENVKLNVQRIHLSQILQTHYAKLAQTPDEVKPVFVHGLVYSVKDGQVFDLQVSVGPEGIPVETTPFPPVR